MRCLLFYEIIRIESTKGSSVMFVLLLLLGKKTSGRLVNGDFLWPFAIVTVEALIGEAFEIGKVGGSVGFSVFRGG